MTRRHPRALVAAVVTAVGLACAACGSTASPGADGSSSPATSPTSGTSSATSATLTVDQVAPLIVACFADHHLIPKSALAAEKTAKPRADSSAWLHDGKVSDNGPFGEWYRATGSAVAVRGKTIDSWVHEVAASSSAWPTSTCGPMPG